MTKLYYDFKYNETYYQLECGTQAEAEQWAQNWFMEQYEDVCMYNGESKEDEGLIIEYAYADNGDQLIRSQSKFELSFQHYHGDLKEHG